VLANVLLGLGLIALVITLLVVQLIPLWVLLVMAVLALILILPPLLRVRRSQNMVQLQGSFQMPIQIAGAIAMLIGSIVPWLVSVLRPGSF
jgi:hypothetical protein